MFKMKKVSVAMNSKEQSYWTIKTILYEYAKTHIVIENRGEMVMMRFECSPLDIRDLQHDLNLAMALGVKLEIEVK